MSDTVEEDHRRFIRESDEYETTVRRLSLYFQVVKALVPGHGITDDDPERAVVEALEEVDARFTTAGASATARRARELIEEVRER